MPALAAQPFGAATAAPAREPGNATLGPARADEALSRTATSLLHAQQLAGDMIADADQRTARSAAPQMRDGPEVHGLGPQEFANGFRQRRPTRRPVCPDPERRRHLPHQRRSAVRTITHASAHVTCTRATAASCVTLAEVGIHLRDERPGEHRAPCPKCARTRHRARDDALAVRVEADGGATWTCHRCGWRAASGLSGVPADRAKAENSSFAREA